MLPLVISKVSIGHSFLSSLMFVLSKVLDEFPTSSCFLNQQPLAPSTVPSSSPFLRRFSEMTKDAWPNPVDSAFSDHSFTPPPDLAPTREPHHRPTAADDDDEHLNTPPVSPQQQHTARSPSPTISLPHSSSTYPTQPTISSPTRAMSADHSSTAPFVVPKPWQHALSMVSINAGLTPQALLHAYYHANQKQQSSSRRHALPHPPPTPTTTADQTDLDIQQLFPRHVTRDRGIRGVSVRCADGDPARPTLLVIVVDDVDAATGAPVVRFVTNTSVRHVLEEPCADCPLWLPVRTTTVAAGRGGDGKEEDNGGGGGRIYQLVPCCDEWAAAVDFEMPLSEEEKQVPAVVDRLLQELQGRRLALLARERELQDKEDELARLRRRHHQDVRQVSAGDGGDVGVAAPVVEQQYHNHALGFDADVLGQYWWAVAMVVTFLLVVVVMK